MLGQTGSGWVLDYIENITLEVGKCSLIGSGPECKVRRILGHEELINVNINDTWCFASAFAQHFIKTHTIKNTVSWLQENCNTNKSEFPMNIHKVAAFEKTTNILRRESTFTFWKEVPVIPFTGAV